jgi:hypothetical protein
MSDLLLWYERFAFEGLHQAVEELFETETIKPGEITLPEEPWHKETADMLAYQILQLYRQGRIARDSDAVWHMEAYARTRFGWDTAIAGLCMQVEVYEEARDH